MKTLNRTYTLRDILELLNNESLPDTWKCWEDIRPQSCQKVTLAFMAEDETHITAYAVHPILIPWYGCGVTGIDVPEEDTLRIWLDYENFMKKHKIVRFDEDAG